MQIKRQDGRPTGERRRNAPSSNKTGAQERDWDESGQGNAGGFLRKPRLPRHVKQRGRSAKTGRNFHKTKIQLLKGAAGMNTLKAQGEKNISPQEPYHFRKRLGSTTFLVAVHSSKTNTETANDKIARLIRHDATMRKVVNQ